MTLAEWADRIEDLIAAIIEADGVSRSAAIGNIESYCQVKRHSMWRYLNPAKNPSGEINGRVQKRIVKLETVYRETPKLTAIQREALLLCKLGVRT